MNIEAGPTPEPMANGSLRAMAPVLRLDNVHLAFGARPLLEKESLVVEPGERVCIVGRNGEGKSSLLRLVAGEQLPDAGVVWVRPGTRIATLAQDIVTVENATVRAVVTAGLDDHSGSLDHWEIPTRVEITLSQLGLDGDAQYESLSGGWRRRALLARALVCEPELLLLDEPTNHLDIVTIEWLEELLVAYRGALLFVSHDRRFVEPHRHAHRRPGSRAAVELARQLRQLRRTQGVATGQRSARERAVRQAPGAGRSLDPQGRGGAPHAQ